MGIPTGAGGGTAGEGLGIGAAVGFQLLVDFGGRGLPVGQHAGVSAAGAFNLFRYLGVFGDGAVAVVGVPHFVGLLPRLAAGAENHQYANGCEPARGQFPERVEQEAHQRVGVKDIAIPEEVGVGDAEGHEPEGAAIVDVGGGGAA